GQGEQGSERDEVDHVNANRPATHFGRYVERLLDSPRVPDGSDDDAGQNQEPDEFHRHGSLPEGNVQGNSGGSPGDAGRWLAKCSKGDSACGAGAPCPFSSCAFSSASSRIASLTM